ncbi:hypothetical protein BJX99DRAFT_257258 [Aspergillus californicus]
MPMINVDGLDLFLVPQPPNHAPEYPPIPRNTPAAIIEELEDACKSKDFPQKLPSNYRHEIFVTVAQYDSDYVGYLNDENHASDELSFMTMNLFGPFNTRDRGHMRRLGPILLAMSLRADVEERGEL